MKGAKNAVLPILAACLMTEETCEIDNVPLLDDVTAMCAVLASYGASVSLQNNRAEVASHHLDCDGPRPDIMKKMRASNLVLGPLLARCGHACLHFPGGCAIGARPMDYHLRGVEALGAKVELAEGRIHAVAPKLKGTEICFDFPSVGATENTMMAAALAEGVTTVRNAAREPEIQDLAGFLNAMGADIRGAGSDRLEIHGVKRLHGAQYTVMPDRIEAGTLLLAAAITGGDLLSLRGAQPEDLSALLWKMHAAGIHVQWDKEGVRVCPGGELRAVDVTTMPYPGFPTDLQPQFMAMLCCAKGTSLVVENIFENRFRHVPELNRMGADIRLVEKCAVIQGKKKLAGAELTAATDPAGRRRFGVGTCPRRGRRKPDPEN